MAKKVSLEAIRALREKTSASLNDVRVALKSAGGDESKALILLRQRGADIAERRAGRTTSQGRVEAYVHHDGRLGALVEINCETDFVARTPEFLQFCRDVAMHIAAMGPTHLGPEDLPSETAKDAATAKAVCLLEQPFVKDQGLTVKDLLKTLVAKTGENVVIRRFTRFGVGNAATT